MMGRSIVLRGASLLASLSLFACSQAEVADEPVSSASEAVINGTPATDAKYAAVGALVWVLPGEGVVEVFCSATLVAAKAVVTARHCMPNIDLAPELGVVAAVAFGPDAFNPTHTIPIKSYVSAPSGGAGNGLLLDGGRDVAVARLASKPAGITPATVGLFEDKLVGQKFQISGYGVYDFSGTYGKRYGGNVTARALGGKWYPLLFNNNFKTFRSWYYNDSSAAQDTEAEANEWWKLYKLESGYELLAGGLRGESVGCFGDSGGPLLQGTKASNLTTYGVSFAAEGQNSTVCGLGGGYAVFNKKMRDFVQKAL